MSNSHKSLTQMFGIKPIKHFSGLWKGSESLCYDADGMLCLYKPGSDWASVAGNLAICFELLQFIQENLSSNHSISSKCKIPIEDSRIPFFNFTNRVIKEEERFFKTVRTKTKKSKSLWRKKIVNKDKFLSRSKYNLRETRLEEETDLEYEEYHDYFYDFDW